MKIFQAFLKGWYLVARFPLFAVLKYGLTFIFAYVILNPYLQTLKNYVANRTAAEEQAKNPSLSFIAEFTDMLSDDLVGMWQSSSYLMILFWVANVLLTAGLLSSYANHLRGDRITFISGVRRNFFPLGMLFLGFVALFIIGTGLWATASNFILGAYPPLWREILSLIMTGWLLWFAWLVYDMSRIIICADVLGQTHPSRQMAIMLIKPITAAFRAMMFVLRKPSVWIISLVFLLIQAFWILGIHKEWFSFGSLGVLIIGQIIVFARTATHLSMLGAQAQLWVIHEDQRLHEAALSHSYDESLPSEPETSESEVGGGIDWSVGADEPEQSAPLEPMESYEDEDSAYLEAARASEASSTDGGDQGSGNAAT